MNMQMNAALRNEVECTIAEAAILMELLLDGGDSVMLWGGPGLGKTSVVYQLGARRRWKVIEFKTNIREPVDVRGVPVCDPVTKKTVWFVPDELPQVERDGEFGILLIDEINTGTSQMMAVMMGLVLERRIGDYVLPAGWKIVATGNRVSDRAAAQRMPTALRNRFAHIVVLPDVDAFCDWGTVNGVPVEAIAFIRLRRELIHVMPKGDENAFMTPRSFTKASKYVTAPRNVRRKLFATHVGNAAAGEFDAFIDLYHSFGSIEDAVNNPTTAPVPTEASLRYAVCTGVARMATKANFGKVMTYVKRLNHRESELLVMHDATLRDASLKNTAEYGAWAIANQDLILQ
jgi:AAA domain (dynein-related subfamily)